MELVHSYLLLHSKNVPAHGLLFRVRKHMIELELERTRLPPGAGDAWRGAGFTSLPLLPRPSDDGCA